VDSFGESFVGNAGTRLKLVLLHQFQPSFQSIDAFAALPNLGVRDGREGQFVGKIVLVAEDFQALLKRR